MTVYIHEYRSNPSIFHAAADDDADNVRPTIDGEPLVPRLVAPPRRPAYAQPHTVASASAAVRAVATGIEQEARASVLDEVEELLSEFAAVYLAPHSHPLDTPPAFVSLRKKVQALR